MFENINREQMRHTLEQQVCTKVQVFANVDELSFDHMQIKPSRKNLH